MRTVDDKIEEGVMKNGMGILILVLATAACRTLAVRDECPMGETRCDGEVAQICDANGQWQTLLDCNRVSELNRAAFACAPIVVEDDEVGRLPGHTCVPAGTPPVGGTDGGAP